MYIIFVDNESGRINNPAQEWMVKAMYFTPDGVMDASNSFRYARPDMYLDALSHNRHGYISAVLNGGIYAPIKYINPRETVPAMVQDLVNNKSYMV